MMKTNDPFVFYTPKMLMFLQSAVKPPGITGTFYYKSRANLIQCQQLRLFAKSVLKIF